MGNFFCAGKSPINSFNQVIDASTLSAYSPDLSQEIGFPESRDCGGFPTWSHEVLQGWERRDYSETKYASSPHLLSLYVGSQVTRQPLYYPCCLCAKNPHGSVIVIFSCPDRVRGVLSEDSSKVILETFDQSDGETWPDQQKDEDKHIKRPNNCCGLTIERDTGASMPRAFAKYYAVLMSWWW